MFYTILFFIAGPLIIGIGNLILGPIFNKRVPFHVHVRSFVVGTVIYLILATIGYFLLLQGKL
ncbi:hypothetical protein WL555_06275 [Staphylococcus warneri]|jgi:uncharacterized membrane protein YcaP (DUF421 family)|uniref:Uncharacterized protein n=2 Tax=Staphylococcus warneri TaxID=1292 RepID=A0A2V3ZAP7_STAWA|nr:MULTISPECIES: hypothetical protein [Staphylococcus]MBJ7886144.1 hypothetical protein [Bacillaceae bacterium HSR45]MCC8989160.1 hypothetical protein [Staphylococcus sp.]MCR4456108.1 hypothetical protein [Aeromonas salmonicida]QAV30276.1 hypothetical protein SD1155_01275 [Sulfitobacter donghicola]CRG02378.1 Uncharacterised protein [Streptococcus pneumoniae]SKR75802.1 Uncharacterised protein [Mycobacteroides abscessus subsp. abscessus]